MSCQFMHLSELSELTCTLELTSNTDILTWLYSEIFSSNRLYSSIVEAIISKAFSLKKDMMKFLKVFKKLDEMHNTYFCINNR